MTTSNYPEHDKLRAISDKSQVCGEFLEWLQSEGIVLAEFREFDEYVDPQFVPCCRNTLDLLADFFDIDRDKIEVEKRAMLDSLRSGVSAQ